MTIATAKGLGMFRDELGRAGFEPDMVRDLVVAACQADVSTSGLSVEMPAEPVALPGREPSTNPKAAGGFVPGPDTERE